MKLKKIAIVACSNGIDNSKQSEIDNLIYKLKDLDLTIVLSKFIFKKFSIFNGNDIDKALELNLFFKDKSIDGIFDISGGDLSISLLEYLDFKVIKNNPKPFFGYSDLTVILNSIYSKTSIHTYNYQLRNIINDKTNIQFNNFKNFLEIFDNSSELEHINCKFIQKQSMEGIIIGGNIRCLLKLSGTSFMPDFNKKILLLEACSGDTGKIYSYLIQLKLIGAFENINGILLGTFTEMENKLSIPNVESLVTTIVNNPNIPIAKTIEIGHNISSKCISIGKFYKF